MRARVEKKVCLGLEQVFDRRTNSTTRRIDSTEKLRTMKTTTESTYYILKNRIPVPKKNGATNSIRERRLESFEDTYVRELTPIFDRTKFRKTALRNRQLCINNTKSPYNLRV